MNSAKDDADFEGEGSAVRSENGATNAVFVRNTDGEITAIFTEIDGADISFIVEQPK